MNYLSETDESELSFDEIKALKAILKQIKINSWGDLITDVSVIKSNLIKLSGIPKMFSFDGFDVTDGNFKAYSAALSYPDTLNMNSVSEQEYGDKNEHKPFLTLIGGYGTGKTRLALSIGSSILQKYGVESNREIDFIVIYRQVSDLMNELRRGFKDDTVYDLLDKCKMAKLLILDDLGAEKPTEYVTQTIEEIIDYRYIRESYTIITSNKQSFSPRIASRISDTRIGQVIQITGEDYRKKVKGNG
jgi:DNA replication protein DnaC